MRHELLEQLQQGCAELGLSLADSEQQCLIDYLEILASWNRKHNLTAVRDIRLMVRRHLLDSLAVFNWIGDSDVLDVGAGAGLPGIPLAIVKPHLTVTLVDSVSKKTRFMLFVAAQLGLKNVTVVHTRVEQMQSPLFEQIIARAFAAPEKLLSLSGHLLAPGGRVLALTAATDLQVGDRVAEKYNVINSEVLSVPGEQAPRNIVIFEKDLNPSD